MTSDLLFNIILGILLSITFSLLLNYYSLIKSDISKKYNLSLGDVIIHMLLTIILLLFIGISSYLIYLFKIQDMFDMVGILCGIGICLFFNKTTLYKR